MIGDDAAPVIVDPFRGGIHVGPEELPVLLAETNLGRVAAFSQIAAMPNRAILVRLLLNQATRAEQSGQLRRALELYGRMTVMAPDYGMRGGSERGSSLSTGTLPPPARA